MLILLVNMVNTTMLTYKKYSMMLRAKNFKRTLWWSNTYSRPPVLMKTV